MLNIPLMRPPRIKPNPRPRSVHVALNARLVPARSGSSTYVDPWDLHVGARLGLLGRKLTLRRARDAATTRWLDQQVLWGAGVMSCRCCCHL